MDIQRTLLCTLLLIFICSAFPGSVRAQEPASPETPAESRTDIRELGSLEEIVEYAYKHNLSYRQDLWEVGKAQNDIEGLLRIDQSSFSFTRDIPVVEDPDADKDPEYSAGVTVPVLDQFSLSASIDQDNDITSALNFTPLAHDDLKEQDIIAYEKALIDAEQSALDVRNEAVTAALTWMDLSRQLNTQDARATMKGTAYEEEKIRYDAGESTLDAVKEALLEWSEAQGDRTSLQQKERTARTDLYSILHADTSELVVSVITLSALREAIEQLEETSSIDQTAPESAAAVLLADLDARSLEEKRKNTWLFEPDLNAGLSITRNSDQDLQVAATVSFSFGLDDFNRAEREELAVDIELAREQHQQTLEQSLLEYEEQMLALEAAQAAREIRDIELEQTELLHEEAKFLHNQGDISELELDDARITYEQAENSLFSALVEEYTALLDLFY